MDKQQILREALNARNNEIMGYQINIDNYSLAIQHINESQDLELTEFCERLKELLKSEKLEQKKAMVIRRVLQQQLES